MRILMIIFALLVSLPVMAAKLPKSVDELEVRVTALESNQTTLALIDNNGEKVGIVSAVAGRTTGVVRKTSTGLVRFVAGAEGFNQSETFFYILPGCAGVPHVVGRLFDSVFYLIPPAFFHQGALYILDDNAALVEAMESRFDTTNGCLADAHTGGFQPLVYVEGVSSLQLPWRIELSN